MSVLIFLAILVILILVHEFGHFAVAKLFGIRVDEFGIGFPPKLAGWKYGETEYTVNALPFGGFVKIFGENPGESEHQHPEYRRSFISKPWYMQAAVLVAGVAMNVVLAWVLFSAGFMIGMQVPVTDENASQVKDIELYINGLVPGSPALEGGLKVGDKITAVKTELASAANLSPDAVTAFIGGYAGKEITVEWMRGTETGSSQIVPEDGVLAEAPTRAAIGISMAEVGTIKLPFFQSLASGFTQTYDFLIFIAQGIFDFIASALALNADFEQVTGPVGIVSYVGEAAALGIVNLLSFMALISLNLAIINLLPFPALDGGRLLFVAIEAIKGSPIKPSIANAFNSIGFALLILLMVVVTFNDIAKLL